MTGGLQPIILGSMNSREYVWRSIPRGDAGRDHLIVSLANVDLVEVCMGPNPDSFACYCASLQPGVYWSGTNSRDGVEQRVEEDLERLFVLIEQTVGIVVTSDDFSGPYGQWLGRPREPEVVESPWEIAQQEN